MHNSNQLVTNRIAQTYLCVEVSTLGIQYIQIIDDTVDVLKLRKIHIALRRTFQIGLVMLVGLAAKNAILIVEFAKVQVDKGEDLIQSAIYAAKLRFRPILMTSLAFVLGMLPMVLASGPGSASRQAIGTGVFFGMIFAIVFGIILVPFFFVMVYKTKSKILKHKKS